MSKRTKQLLDELVTELAIDGNALYVSRIPRMKENINTKEGPLFYATAASIAVNDEGVTTFGGFDTYGDTVADCVKQMHEIVFRNDDDA